MAGYAAAATPDLIARYESFDPRQLYQPVLDLFPAFPGRVADIGAVTGRDAAWFAGQGHEVVAVEPVRQLREAVAANRADPLVLWLDDRLPELTRLSCHPPFDLITLCGVWQHIDDPERIHAMANIARLMRPGGHLVMSLRHGPGAPGRAVFPVSDASTVALARDHRLQLVRLAERDSIQPGNRAMGVRWSWLAFSKPA